MQSVTPRTHGIVNLRLKYNWTEAAHKHQVQVDPPALLVDPLLYIYSVLHTFAVLFDHIYHKYVINIW